MSNLIRMGLFICLIIAPYAHADLRVWTTTETRRVLREDPAGEAKAVKLQAARNEWRSFQILMRSDSPIAGISIQPADLTGPNASIIRAADARLYREHQLHLTEPTYRNKDFKPGWYPDALIPFQNPLTGQPLKDARFVAVPFDLPAAQTHGFWIDIYVPTDAKPGQYSATYTITTASAQPIQIPLSLTVWDFALPATPTMQTAFGSPAGNMRGYYRNLARAGKEKEPTDWAAIDRQCAQVLSENRLNATPPPGSMVPRQQPDGSFRIPSEQVDAFRTFVDTYHINAFETVHPRSVIKDPQKEESKLRAWLASWDAAARELNRPQVVFYTYLLDEPNDKAAYEYVQTWGRAIRAAKSALKVMVVEQTKTQDPAWGDLNGAIDIWCPLFCLHDEETAAQRRALGETIWTYTALCQGREKSPWWHIDYPLLHYRVPAWIAWRYHMEGLLYWGGLSHWSQVEDPWTDSWTYRPRGEGRLVYHGEGSIVYPARAVGYDGIAPSMRLKALRDSIEDYEYLAILQRLGKSAEAEKIVLPIASSFFRWEGDPAAYDKAREKLAEIIVAAGAK